MYILFFCSYLYLVLSKKFVYEIFFIFRIVINVMCNLELFVVVKMLFLIVEMW